MKVLCIRTSPGGWSGIRVFSGRVYTVIHEVICPTCSMRWFAVAEVPKPERPRLPMTPRCGACGYRGLPDTDLKHFKAWRFVPIEPDKNVTLDEVHELYTPTERVT